MNDDIANSRMRVSRRRALGLGGSIGLTGLLAACAVPGADDAPGASATPTASDGAPIAPTTTAAPAIVAKLDAVGACTMTAAEMQGPYYFDVDSIRSDIREDRPGTRLDLALRVYDRACEPIPNCVVEVWHCDAGGVYSGFEVSSTAGGTGIRMPDGKTEGSYTTGAPETEPDDDGTYLRGAQVADANGIVQFSTIWPGWYAGRTVHVHLKVHLNKREVLVSQLYFDDAQNDAVFASAPYSEHPGRDTSNDDDSIFHASGILTVEPAGDGYLAYANLSL